MTSGEDETTTNGDSAQATAGEADGVAQATRQLGETSLNGDTVPPVKTAEETA